MTLTMGKRGTLVIPKAIRDEMQTDGRDEDRHLPG